MNTKFEKLEMAYGICESLTFPCFLRIVYLMKGDYKIQIFEDNRLVMASVNLELDVTSYLPIKNSKKLNIREPNYAIALDKKTIFCGTKNYIATAFSPYINRCSPYFQVEYYTFMEDYIHLMYAYRKLVLYPAASEQTKTWATTELKKIQDMIVAIKRALLSSSFQRAAKRLSQIEKRGKITSLRLKDRHDFRYKDLSKKEYRKQLLFIKHGLHKEVISSTKADSMVGNLEPKGMAKSILKKVIVIKD